jgi:hypothetical protein
MSTLKILVSVSVCGSALFLAQSSASAQGKGGNCQRSRGQMPLSTSTGIVGSPSTGLTTTATPIDPATSQQIVTMSSALQTLIDGGTMTPAQQQRAATVLSIAARVRQTGVMTQSQKHILGTAYASLQKSAASTTASTENLQAASTVTAASSNQSKAKQVRAQSQLKQATARRK